MNTDADYRKKKTLELCGKLFAAERDWRTVKRAIPLRRLSRI